MFNAMEGAEDNVISSNRIDELFRQKQSGILSVYFTAGYPHLDSMEKIIVSLDKAGTDMIEIGIPFSDPVADGEIIQNSNQTALENGMTVSILLDQLVEVRKRTDIPMIIMTYLNPVYHYGMEKFCKTCYEIGIDGLIIPDLPPHEVEESYSALFAECGLHFVMMVTAQTPEDRIHTIDKNASGFIYAVSSASTTGTSLGINAERNSYFQRLNDMSLLNPVLIGFGISNRVEFQNACKYASGAIIGSAFIRTLKNKELGNSITDFVNGIIK